MADSSHPCYKKKNECSDFAKQPKHGPVERWSSNWKQYVLSGWHLLVHRRSPGYPDESELLNYYLYLRWKHSGIQIRESTNWHGHSAVKDPSNANRRKWERKIEGPFFHPPPSNPGPVCSADYRHRGSTNGRLFRTCRSCRTCYSSHHSLTQGRRKSAPRSPCIPVTRRYIHFCNDRVHIQQLEEALKQAFHGC